MLLKWLFLLLVAWYIYRAAGNLFGAMLGRREQPERIRRTEPTDSVHRSSAAPEDAHSKKEKGNIEDARWKDI